MVQAQYGTLITNIGLAKIANAQVTQSKVGLENIALGDGNGAHYVPTQNQTALVNEVWRGPVVDVSIDPKNNNRITVKAVIPVTVGGFTIREIGVFDNEGFLIAVGQYPEKYKPQLIEGVAEETIIHFVIETNNANVVKLNIDPTVIIASQEYVDKKFNYLDSRIGDTSKLETDYKKDTVGAVNEIQHELNDIVESLGFHEPISEVLERGANEINAPVKTLCSVVGLEGRTITNYAPLFDGGTWVLTENTATTTIMVVRPNKLSVTVNDITKPIATAWSYITGLVPGKTYIMSMISTFNAYIDYYTANGLHSRVPVYINGVSQSFTVPTDTSIIKIALSILEPDTGRKTGTFTAENVQINEGNTALPFVANMQGITNPTIENIRDNLIPAFHMGGAVHVPGWMYLTVIDHTGTPWEATSNPRVLVPVVPGTKYTFSCIRNAQVKITTNKGSHLDADQLTTLFEESTVQNGNMNCTFTVPAGINFIRIVFMTTAGGYVSSPMMVKGSTPAVYKPQVREALTVKTTLHTGESLKVDVAGQLVKTKKYETIELGDVNARYIGIQTGLHLVDIALGLVGNDIPATLIKFNGAVCKQLNYTTGNSGNDTFYLDSRIATVDGGELRISIADTESGWGPTYQPTPAEIKAYFMGWKMYADGAGGRNELYETAKGTKYWYPISRVNDTFDSAYRTVSTAPTTFANNKASWQPYKLRYLLKTPVSEVVATAGSLTLDEGENMLVVSEGRIVREVTKPYHYKTTTPDGTVYNRYEINTQTQSPLAYNTANILQVYKNGKPDYTWRIENVAIAGSVRALLDANLFDPTAVYTVDYIPQEKYRVSVPTNVITVEYADKLGGVIQSLVTTAAKLGAQASNMQNSPSFRFGKDEGGLYIIIDEDVIT